MYLAIGITVTKVAWQCNWVEHGYNFPWHCKNMKTPTFHGAQKKRQTMFHEKNKSKPWFVIVFPFQTS